MGKYTFEPMKAASIVAQPPAKKNSYKLTLEEVTWPKLVTPKIDGIRAIKKDNKVVSRKMLPIPNYHVRSICEAVLKEGMDVELYVPGIREVGDYNASQDAIMSDGGQPDFRAGVIDIYQFDDPKGYTQRIADLIYLIEDSAESVLYQGTATVIPVHHVENADEYQTLLKQFLDDGYEGACLRDPDGPYKFGRSTATEQWLLKHKLMEDTEAIIVGFEELHHNTNENVRDAFGHSKRSTAAGGKLAGGTLGSYILKNAQFGIFNAAPTGSLAERRAVWDARGSLFGTTVTVEFMPHGTKDKPRHPRVKGPRYD